MKKIALLLFFLGVIVSMKAIAQITFNFSPVIYGQNLDGLSFVQILSSVPSEIRGTIKITVKDEQSAEVITIITPMIVIRNGLNRISNADFIKSYKRFGNSKSSNILRQTGRFGEGEYEYCYEFLSDPKDNDSEISGENCFNYSIQPLTPLLLVYPSDGDELCNTRPNFTWLQPQPVTSSINYRLMLSEQKNKQSPEEAIANNVPIINESRIVNSGSLLYPPQARELEKGKKYVWQVTAFSGKAILTKSEIWEFTIQCEKEPVDTVRESYRQLKPFMDGNFYLSKGLLKIGFHNPYVPGKLIYTISDLSKPGKEISGLPEMKMISGINKMDIDIKNIKGFENNHQYLLRIKNAGNQELLLKFIFLDE